MSNKRQRAIAKRLKRKPARERQKARARREYNRSVQARRHYDDAADLMAPIALAVLASHTPHHPRKP